MKHIRRSRLAAITIALAIPGAVILTACGGGSSSPATTAPATTPATTPAPSGAPTEAQVVSVWNSTPNITSNFAKVVAIASPDVYSCNIGTTSATQTSVELYVPNNTTDPSAQVNFSSSGAYATETFAPGTPPGGGGDTCTLHSDGTISLG